MILAPDDRLPEGPARWSREALAEAWSSCRRDLRAVLQDPEITTVAVLVGIPGSGKSAWTREHDQPGLAIFDACWTNRGRRMGIARQIRAAGKAAIAVWVQTPLDVCRERNARRPPDRRVPDVVLSRSWVALRHQPPVLAEGWSRVLVQDGQAALVRDDAVSPEKQLERLARAPAQQAMALLRGRVLPAYRAAQASRVGQGSEAPPARVTRSIAAMGRALERGAAGDDRVNRELGRLGARLEGRQREAWAKRVRSETGASDWTPEPQEDVVSEWAERVGQEVADVRARVAPGVEALVQEAWRKGWSATELETHVVKHGVPLEGGGTAEGQGSLVGHSAHRGLEQSCTEAQATALGADEYTWRHSGAKNPDPEHLAADGKIHRWSERPSYGHPGDRRSCGCKAVPVLGPAILAKLAGASEEPKPSRSKSPLDQELREFRKARERALEQVASELGVGDELAALAKRQAAVLGGRRGVTPTGDTVRDLSNAQPQLDKWVDGLNDEQIDALKSWSDEGWIRRMREIDSGRGVEVDNQATAKIALEAERHVTAMREALKTAPVSKGEVLRGMRDLPSSSALRKALETKGSVVELDTMSSWTDDEYEARSFADDSPGSFILRVRTARGALISDPRVSYTSREREIVLDRGSRFRVEKVSRREFDEDRLIVELVELPPG